MYWRANLFSLLFSIILFVLIIELIRRRKLQERYSILWLLVVFFMIVLSFSRRLLDLLARAVGIYYPPAALFLMALLFMLALLLHYSLAISRLSEENKALAQKLALLENQLNEEVKQV